MDLGKTTAMSQVVHIVRPGTERRSVCGKSLNIVQRASDKPQDWLSRSPTCLTCRAHAAAAGETLHLEMRREANLVWILDKNPGSPRPTGSPTHVRVGEEHHTLCGLDFDRRNWDDQYGEPECKKCFYLLNNLSRDDLVDAGLKEWKELEA